MHGRMFRISRGLILGGLLVAAMGTTEVMAGTTGQVTLGGTVASTLSIVTTPTAAAASLPLDGQGASSEHIVKVADLDITTNNEQGFTLTATSGSLTKVGGTAIAFQVTSVVDAASAPVSGDFLVSSGSSYTHATSGAGPESEDLYIKYTPAALQDPGSYAGSIDLTVADN